MRESSEFKYVGPLWPACVSSGWDHPSIIEAQKRKLPKFQELISGTQPLSVVHEADPPVNGSLVHHNLIMTYGYVLARSAKEGVVRIVDLGCGLEHYRHLANALLPDFCIEYTGYDLHSMGGLFPRDADLVIASGMMNYLPEWHMALAAYAASTGSARIYITRLPTTVEAPSYVFSQNARKHGYDTDLIGWCLNKTEFLDEAASVGLTLDREFMVEENPFIDGAPEQPVSRGFLFLRGGA